MNRLEFKPYTPDDRQIFTAMLCDYFNNDLNEGMDPGRFPLIAARIEYEIGIYDMCLYILYAQELAGFIWFQTDTPENPWCLKPGWGFIREIYICPQLRRLGLGEAAVREAVSLLRKSGVKKIYLTTESQNTRTFWNKLGFYDSGEICVKNGLNIFINKKSGE